MLWIVTTFIAFVALLALGALWRHHRHQVQRLQQTHAERVRLLDEEHDRRVLRLSREHETNLLTAHHPLANELLPAMDSLEQALLQVEAGTPESLEAFRDGMELARQGMLRALERHGITVIDPGPGEPFDPRYHEAISTVALDDPREEAQAGSVAICHRPGYRDGERILRAAMVSIFQGSKDEDSSDQELYNEDEEEVPDPLETSIRAVGVDESASPEKPSSVDSPSGKGDS